MTTTDVEDRIRHALADLAGTTTTSADAFERVSERARPRSSRTRVVLLAAAALTAIVAGLVFAAVALRGPGSTVDTPRGPAASSTPVTTLPDGTTTWTFTGEDEGGAWSLRAHRSPDGQLSVVASRNGGAGVGFEDVDPSRVFAAAGSGGGSSVPLVLGSTPPSASSARATLPDGTVLPIDVVGDGDGMGVRLFVTTLPAGTTGTVTFEAFAADGTRLGESSIPFR